MSDCLLMVKISHLGSLQVLLLWKHSFTNEVRFHSSVTSSLLVATFLWKSFKIVPVALILIKVAFDYGILIMRNVAL